MLPHPTKPGRLVGYCGCNPAGPVLEVDGDAHEVTETLSCLPGVNEELAADLHKRGLHNLDDVRAASDEELLAVPHIGKRTLAKIRAYLAQEEER